MKTIASIPGRRPLVAAALSMAALAALPGSELQPWSATDALAATDAFVCYKAKKSKGSTSFGGATGVALNDHFETNPLDLKKAASLCLPATLSGVPPADDSTHLESYKGKAPKTSPKHERRGSYRVVDQFAEYFMDTVKAESLMVPTTASSAAPPVAPDPLSHDVDHFKCYKVKKPRGYTVPAAVQVDSSFNQPVDLELKKPKRLCLPVDKNGEGIKDSDAHLLCYQAKRVKGQAKFAKVIDTFTANQFGDEKLDAIKESLLCVPTVSVQGCGDGLINEPGEQCDDGNNDNGDGCAADCTAELPFAIRLVNLNMLQDISSGVVGYDDIDDRITLLAAQVVAADPDVMTLQEVVLGPNGSAADLVAELAATHGLTYFYAEHGFGSGQAVVSRWPASAEEWEILPNIDLVTSFPDRRVFGRVVVSSPAGQLDVYPAHLCAFCNDSERDVHAASFADFVARTHTSGHPAVVGADFNAHKGSAGDQQASSEPAILTLEALGWTTLFDGSDAPCNAPTDRSGCTSGIDNLTDPADTTDSRIDNIMLVPAALHPLSGTVSDASETGPTTRFADTPGVDGNARCSFEPALFCAVDGDCPSGSHCEDYDPSPLCRRDTPVSCLTDGDCPGDLAPDTCATTLWTSDHVGLQTTISLEALPPRRKN